ncbi:MAG: clostripain-related cysteine peptidase [Candidatus Melainabacteria bacterium]|nr:clostripain-related cysteine peptidase [Candidatus Melainabacteria bacterium]
MATQLDSKENTAEIATSGDNTGEHGVNRLTQEGIRAFWDQPLTPKTVSPEPPYIQFAQLFASETKPQKREGDSQFLGETVNLTESDQPNTPRTWTMAIQLTSSGTLEADGRQVNTGAARKSEEILRLAKLTENSSVTLYVQSVDANTERSDKGVNGDKTPTVSTYRIEGGKVTLVEQRPSQSPQADLESLMGRASKRAGDGHLGLVIQSHGTAESGIYGDTGILPLEQLKESLAITLKANGRDSLDLLNFDSCSMGNLDVAAFMSGVARHMVASSELEHSFGVDVDGQNITRTLTELLANPTMSPHDFAQRSIRLAQQGANDDAGNLVSDTSGTETLAHVDTSKMERLAKSVESLGALLGVFVQNPAHRSEMLKLIDQLPSFGSIGIRANGTIKPERRDLGLFLDKLDESIKSGKFGVVNEALIASIAEAKAAQRDAIAGYHGENYKQYDRMSGISLLLPGSATYSLENLTAELSPFGMIALAADSTKFANFDSRVDFASSLRLEAEQIDREIGGNRVSGMLDKISSAQTPAEFDAALAQLKQGLKESLESPAGIEIERKARQQASETVNEHLRSRSFLSTPGWQAFLLAMQER